MIKKWGRNGQFLTCEKYPKCNATLSVEDKNAVDQPAANIKCDKCGADMLIKIGRYGKFYGCSNYPKCNGIKPVTLGIKCPKCNEGEILMRKGGKTKRIFYGCTRYPDCDFLVNSIPVMKNCENCDNKYLLKKSSKKDGDYLECPACKHKYVPESVENRE